MTQVIKITVELNDKQPEILRDKSIRDKTIFATLSILFSPIWACILMEPDNEKDWWW